MKSSEPLTITSSVISNINSLSRLAAQNPEDERQLYFAIANLSEQERAELYALYMLGSAGIRSYKVAFASARNQNSQHIAATLAEKRNLASCVNLGLKRLREKQFAEIIRGLEHFYDCLDTGESLEGLAITLDIAAAGCGWSKFYHDVWREGLEIIRSACEAGLGRNEAITYLKEIAKELCEVTERDGWQ